LRNVLTVGYEVDPQEEQEGWLTEVDATSSYFELYSFVARQIENYQSSVDGNSSTTIVGHRTRALYLDSKIYLQ
jgi:hypothetical protein